jgi:4-hydroxybenzoate polyprenyltransferase
MPVDGPSMEIGKASRLAIMEYRARPFPEAVQRVGRLLGCLRYRELLVLQGAPAMGMVLAIGKLTAPKSVLGAVFAAANLCLVAHVWSLNDWADRHADALDGAKAAHHFTRKGVDPTTMLGFSLALLMASLALFTLLPATTAWIAAGLVMLGFLYSCPGLHAKGVAGLSSVAHLAGGFLHFLLGYSLFAAVDGNALRTAIVFALIFTAGHAVQEVQDHDADRRAGVRTMAVIFGKRTVFWTALAIFLFAYGYLAYLAATGVVPRRLGPPSLGLAALHVYWARQALHAYLSCASIRVYRDRYRALFGLIGLIVISTLFC